MLREGLTISITLDVNKLDEDRNLADQGKMTPPPSEQGVFNHEIGHAIDKDTDLVAEYNESGPEAEAEANGFARTAASQKDTLSEQEAEKQVRDIWVCHQKRKIKSRRTTEYEQDIIRLSRNLGCGTTLWAQS